MKATLTLILAVIAAQITFADGLIKITYVQITQDVTRPDMVSYPSSYSGGQWTIRRGDVYKLEGYNSNGSQCLVSQGAEKGWIPTSSASMIPAGNADYAEAERLYSAAVSDQQKRVADGKKDQQAADRNDAVKNPNVTVHIDNP